MSIGRTLFEVSYKMRETFRNYEKVSKKLINKELYLIFNLYKLK